MENKFLISISSQFDIEGIIKNIQPFGEGLINDTYIVETQTGMPNYILQRKNKQIFTNIPAMMNNIAKVTAHLQKKIAANKGDIWREALSLTKTKTGELYYLDQLGDYWTACYLIPDTITHHRAETLDLAFEGGAAIGKFQANLSDMKELLENILPGFHDISFRFVQWDEVLQKDPKNRKKDLKKEIEWVESRRSEMLCFWQKVESGKLPLRVTHNDTKISNILFETNNKALAVIDLDTVLNSTCLNDYGDAIRSYANTGLEDDKDPDRVSLNMDIFKAYTNGYLSEALSFLTDDEIANMAFSVRYITFEQMLRFLIDYIQGDTYYKIKYPDHNLVRTHAQYRLLESVEENFISMQEFINQKSNEYKTNL